MRSQLLSVAATLALLSLTWAVVAPTDAGANQHAPIVSFDQVIAPVEILAGRLHGGQQPGGSVVHELHQVPPDRTLVITDIQVRATAVSPMLLRDGLPVIEATHAPNAIGITPDPTAGHTSISAGVEFGPGSRVQLRLQAGNQTQFVALRGYYKTIGVPVVTILVGDDDGGR